MTTTMTESLTVEQFIARPPARVWKALTTPADIANWWMPGDISATPGHRFTLNMGEWGEQECEILEANEPEVLVYRFAHWVLTWRLHAEDGGTRLVLTQSGFSAGNPNDEMAYQAMGHGWRTQILPALAKLVESRA